MRQLVRVGDAAHGTDDIPFHFECEDTKDFPLDPHQQRGKAVRLGYAVNHGLQQSWEGIETDE